MFCPNCGHDLTKDLRIVRYEEEEVNEALWDYVRSQLSGSQYEIIQYRYVKKMSYEEIGIKFFLTKEAIRQRISNIIQKLRVKHSMEFINILLGRDPSFGIKQEGKDDDRR